MLTQFEVPPEAFGRREKYAFAILFVVIALSRGWAVSGSMWDWDEALFARSVLEFDVPAHRPHPPGFPLYVALGKIVNLVVHDPFRSLQFVNLFFAVLLFPATVSMAREVRLRPRWSLFAGALISFLPAVWFFGGTAFSDIPAMVLVILAIALLLRGCRSSTALLAGAIVLAAAVGIRSQNAVIGVFPFLLASFLAFRRRSFLAPILGAILGLAIVIGTYAAAAEASGGWEAYQSAIASHRTYIQTVDSYQSATRPPLWKLVDDFFVRHFRTRSFDYFLALLALAGAIGVVVRRRWPIIFVAVSFAPFLLSAWLLLDILSIGRFALGYLPLFVLLIAAAGEMAEGSGEKQWRKVIAIVGSSFVLAFLVLWGIPAIRETRRISPTEEAMRWIRANVSPAEGKLYVAFGMVPFVEYSLPDYRMEQVLDERAIPVEGRGELSYLVTEGATGDPSGENFIRPRDRLWKIVRQRYFEVCVVPLRNSARFAEGWYEAENTGAEVWRWMGRRSVTWLPAVAGLSTLRLNMQFPLDTLPSTPTVTVRFNGKIVDEFRPSDWQLERRYELVSLSGAENELVIETSVAVNPLAQGLNDDPRDLGILLRSMSWGKVVATKR